MQYYTLTEIYDNTARKNISAVHTALTDGTSTIYLSNILVVQSFSITYQKEIGSIAHLEKSVFRRKT